jgi:iron complex transport system ATP-binding protein
MYSDRIAMLQCGTIAAAGTPSEVLTVDRIRDVFRAEVVVDLHPAATTPRVTVLR